MVTDHLSWEIMAASMAPIVVAGVKAAGHTLSSMRKKKGWIPVFHLILVLMQSGATVHGMMPLIIRVGFPFTVKPFWKTLCPEQCLLGDPL